MLLLADSKFSEHTFSQLAFKSIYDIAMVTKVTQFMCNTLLRCLFKNISLFKGRIYLVNFRLNVSHM